MVAWAFVVGINAYPADSGLKALHGAVADAAEFAEWALHPDGGAVTAANLYFWTCPAPATASLPTLSQFMAAPTQWPNLTPDFARPPQAGEINQAVELVAIMALRAGAKRLYIFFAGHGFQTKPDSFSEAPQTCFVAGNYHPSAQTRSLVPCDDMGRMLAVNGPPELVFFLDACRSDASIKVSRPSGLWDRRSNLGQNELTAIARSAQPHEVAFEIPLDAPSRGAFSKLLITGLREHRKDGVLTFRDLDDFVSSGIGNLVSPKSQYPDFTEQPKPPKLMLATGPTIGNGSNLVIAFTEEVVGKELLLIGGPNDIRQHLIGSEQPQSIPLAPGAYAIETHAAVELRTFAHSGPGDTHVTI
jgi:hypothetical protein